MRWIFRLIFLLSLGAGLLLAFAYPRLIADGEGAATSTHRVYTPASGFEFYSLALRPSDAPAILNVEMMIEGRFQTSVNRPILNVVVTGDDTPVIEQAVDFARSQPQMDSPQAANATYRAQVGIIDPIEAENYLVTVSPVNIDGLKIVSVDLEVQVSAAGVDPRALPLGFMLIVVGFIGLILTFRRRRERNPNSQPPPTRWGRG
jgi:hypothetical protein